MKGCYWIATILLLWLLTLLVGGVASAQDPPAVTTNAASGVTTDSATLNGNLTSLGNASSVDVSFEWGLTTSYGNEATPQPMTSTGIFNNSISGLDPGTTYHFRAKAVGNGTAYGSDVTFTTGTTPPAITTNAASGVTADSATLNCSLTSLGTAGSVDVSFEWGLTTGYGNETTPQPMTSTGAFNDSISGLDPGITYHFRAKAVGNGIAYGSDVTFTTGTTPPAITTNAASGVTADSATLNGSLTSLGTAGSVDVSFEWGLTTGYGNETTPQPMTSTGTFNDSISGLDPGITYHFRAKAVGNGIAYGSDVTFTTGTTPPAITTNAASGVTADSATLNGSLTSLGTAGSVDVSFEWGLTTGYGNETTPQPMTSTGTFNDSISGLDPGITYHFRAKAVGNGIAYGSDVTFTSGTTPPAVTTNAASGVTTDSATLNGSLTSLGTAGSVDVSFEWGLTTGYGNETTPQPMTSTGAFSDNISGLDPGITYHFRAKAVGNGTGYGDDMTFITLGQLELEGWGWCTSHNKIVVATLEGYVAMVEREHAAQSFSLHVVGNLTLQLPNAPDDTIELDMYGSRVRSVFYLGQEMTGKSVTFTGTWIDAGGGQYYISTTGMIALPNPEGEVFKTAKLCFVMLRTPEVDVPLTEPGSFLEDVDSMITRFAKLIDRLLDSLIGTGLRDILNSILASIATLVAALRGLGAPYIP